MKKVVLPAAMLSLIFISSCDIKEQKRIDMTQVQQIEDSIPHIIPGVHTIHTKQTPDDNYSTVMIIVGSQPFYKADHDRQQQAAISTGAMLLHVLGPDNSISKGTLMIALQDMNNNETPKEGISLDMKIDSLQKAIYPSAK